MTAEAHFACDKCGLKARISVREKQPDEPTKDYVRVVVKAVSDHHLVMAPVCLEPDITCCLHCVNEAAAEPMPALPRKVPRWLPDLFFLLFVTVAVLLAMLLVRR